MDAEIIVVDNASSDDSCIMVKENFPNVKLIENEKNLGFAKGNNIGVGIAKGEFICILNPDTVIAEDTFHKLLNFIDQKDKVGIVGCRLVNGRGQFLPESKRNIPFVKIAIQKLIGTSKYYYANHLNETDVGRVSVLVGAFMFMKREVYINCRGFDEDYFMYGEDIDLSYRIKKLGFNNYYFGQTTAIHFKGESTLRDKQYARRFYGAMEIFYNKHFGKSFLFNIIVRLGLKLAYLLRGNMNPTIPDVSHYYYKGNSFENLKTILQKKIDLRYAFNRVEENSEIIFDANDVSYKEIISEFGNENYPKSVTYKIIPLGGNYLIGSNDSINRGEIILFEKD